MNHVIRIGVPAIVGLLASARIDAFAAPAPAPSPGPSPTPSATPASASDPCLSLNNLVSRPSFSTSACVIKRNAFLVQTGYANTATSGSAASQLVIYPQTSLGTGIAQNVEFDLNPPSIERVSGSAPAHGDSDGSIGVKIQLGQTSKVTYGVNALYTLQSGTPPFTGSGDGILANVNGSLTLSPAVGLFGTIGYNEQSAGAPGFPNKYYDFQESLGGSVSLPQSFAVYLEAFTLSSTGPSTGGTFGFDTGIQEDVGSRLQLDAEYYDYLTVRGTHQHSVGFGAAYLLGP